MAPTTPTIPSPVAAIAERLVAEGVAPLCAVGGSVQRERQDRLANARERFGDGGVRWRRESAGATDTFFDLASVTKPMTAVAIARAGLDRKAPLSTWLPEARGTPSESVSLELLLAHRAGLDGHRALYAPLLTGGPVDTSAALREAASARRDDAPGAPPEDGFAPVYSDLGYVLAGVALARAVGAVDAGDAIARLVLEPLGIADRAGTVRDLAARGRHGPFAPTEDVAWRGGRIAGAVHDENAWALTGRGGSGHAGIFGTIEAVLIFGEAVLTGVPAADLTWIVRERPGGSLRAGFDGKSPEGSSAGPSMGPRSFGHLGFTGTSLWIDPDARIVVALLTNRVFHGRHSLAIRSARPWVHEGLWKRAHEISSDSS
jgi:CubicO group peptidase (beta-lactamase class C family)